jgi:hypothetical protein
LFRDRRDKKLFRQSWRKQPSVQAGVQIVLKTLDSKPRRSKWKIAVALLVFISSGIFLVTRDIEPAPVFCVTISPGARPRTFRDEMGRLLMRGGQRVSALWKVEEKFFGKRAPINVSAEFFSAPESAIKLLRESPLLGQRIENNGVIAYEFKGGNHAAIESLVQGMAGAEILSRPLVKFGDGVEMRYSEGGSVMLGAKKAEFGASLHIAARNYKASREFFLSAAQSEPWTNSIRTNFNISARVLLPKAQGFLLLQPHAGKTNDPVFGILFEAKD